MISQGKCTINKEFSNLKNINTHTRIVLVYTQTFAVDGAREGGKVGFRNNHLRHTRCILL